jgi:purine nucleoside permease
MEEMKLFPLVALGLLTIASPSLLAQTPVLHPRVVIVSYFEIGSDTGDRPGELQFWVERDHLDRTVEVAGMSRAVRANHDGSEIAVAVGPGNINPAVNLMALGADPRFDLHNAHWLLNGIAGISPLDGTVGAAVWTDFVINGDLAKEIDPREIPSTWKDGFMSLDGESPQDPKGGAGWEDDVRRWTGSEARANRRGNVIRLNTALLQWAYGLTKNTALPEDDAMRKLRLSYRGFPGTLQGPRVQVGANLATEIFWHGHYMDAWAHRWIGFETDGAGHLATTSMNDTGALLALQALTRQGKTDWNNALLLRTASNFDMPPSGVTAAQNLARERHGSYTGYMPALEAAYRTGHVIVAEWLK